MCGEEVPKRFPVRFFPWEEVRKREEVPPQKRFQPNGVGA